MYFPQGQSTLGVGFGNINDALRVGLQKGLNLPTTPLTQNTPNTSGFGSGISGAIGGAWDWLNSGDNMQTLAGIGQTLAGLYMGNKQIKMGERALGLQEDAFNNNLAHSMQSYNTKLADQSKARGYVQGQSDAEIQAHIDQNSLKRV